MSLDKQVAYAEAGDDRFSISDSLAEVSARLKELEKKPKPPILAADPIATQPVTAPAIS